MKIVKIPKGKGKFRVICCPSQGLKERLKLELKDINQICLSKCDLNIVHGFMPGRSVVSNAWKHRHFKYTVTWDLKDFFDTIKPWMVESYLSPEQIKHTFLKAQLDGENVTRAWQGLPTSPAVANLAAVKMDEEIKEFLSPYYIAEYPNKEIKGGKDGEDMIQPNEPGIDTANIASQLMPITTDTNDNISNLNNISSINSINSNIHNNKSNHSNIENLITYTRYADDLTFSFNDYKWERVLFERIPFIAQQHGFIINKSKYRVQDSRWGKRQVTGILVDHTISVSSSYKHMIQAIDHNLKNVKRRFTQKNKKRPRKEYYWTERLRASKEWSLLKPPHPTIDRQISNIEGVINYVRSAAVRHKYANQMVAVGVLEKKIVEYKQYLIILKASPTKDKMRQLIKQFAEHKDILKQVSKLTNAPVLYDAPILPFKCTAPSF